MQPKRMSMAQRTLCICALPHGHRTERWGIPDLNLLKERPGAPCEGFSISESASCVSAIEILLSVSASFHLPTRGQHCCYYNENRKKGINLRSALLQATYSHRTFNNLPIKQSDLSNQVMTIILERAIKNFTNNQEVHRWQQPSLK